MSDFAKEDSGPGLDEAKRRPYYGSCHCGVTRYICWLTLPVKVPYCQNTPGKELVQLFRKCNCNVCHKTGFLHIRLASTPKDFVLLSPLDPFKELSDYRPTNGTSSWMFCKTCGVRCFMMQGKGEVVERDLAAEGVDLGKAKIQGDGKKVRVWAPKADGWKEEQTSWFRINATTLEPRQDGLDLREWKEKNWIQYVNWLDEVKGEQYDRPYEGGTY